MVCRPLQNDISNRIPEPNSKGVSIFSLLYMFQRRHAFSNLISDYKLAAVQLLQLTESSIGTYGSGDGTTVKEAQVSYLMKRSKYVVQRKVLS